MPPLRGERARDHVTATRQIEASTQPMWIPSGLVGPGRLADDAQGQRPMARFAPGDASTTRRPRGQARCGVRALAGRLRQDAAKPGRAVVWQAVLSRPDSNTIPAGWGRPGRRSASDSLPCPRCAAHAAVAVWEVQQHRDDADGNLGSLRARFRFACWGVGRGLGRGARFGLRFSPAATGQRTPALEVPCRA